MALSLRTTARPHDRTTARPHDRTTARLAQVGLSVWCRSRFGKAQHQPRGCGCNPDTTSSAV